MFWRLRHGTGAAGQQQENARLHEQRELDRLLDEPAQMTMLDYGPTRS